MAKYEVSRRILVRKLGLKTGELTGALVSGPCKRRTAVEQADMIGEAVEELSALASSLSALDEEHAANTTTPA